MLKLVAKIVSKFHNNLMVNEFGIIVLLGHVWMYEKKERVLEEEEEGKTNLRGRESIETYRKCKK